MRYWWVNQNQTFDQELSGGYLWSPKRNQNGARNFFYDSMREVAPGDIVFSFNDTFIPAIGVAQSNCYECPKPNEFGKVGANWERIGWKVDVFFHDLKNVIRPRDHMEIIAPLLPDKYAPLQRNGRGLQGVYLTELSEQLGGAIAHLIGHEATVLTQGMNIGDSPGQVNLELNPMREWEDYLRKQLELDETISPTEKEALIVARLGQGKFKQNVRQLEQRCRVTRVNRIEHLRASHIKPWRDSNNSERINGENGFLLTPTIDHLFDRGFISFDNNGDLLISPVSHTESLLKMGVPVNEKFNVGSFSAGQKAFLEFHREDIFLAKRA